MTTQNKENKNERLNLPMTGIRLEKTNIMKNLKCESPCPQEQACYTDPVTSKSYCVCAHTMKPPGADSKCQIQKAKSEEFQSIPVVIPTKPVLKNYHINNTLPNSTIKTEKIIYPFTRESTTSKLSIYSNYTDTSLVNSTIKTQRVSHPVVTKLTIPIAMILACGIVLLLVGVCLMWKISCSDSISKRRKTHKNKALVVQLTEGVLMEERYTTNPQYTSAGASSETVPSTVPLIERSTITDLQEIGEGFFGKVYKGQFHVIHNDVERIETVAVKMLKRTTNVEAEEDFMREVEIMSSFNHENILSLTGFCPRDDTNAPWMVFEYMPFGDLATVLRNSNHQFWLHVPGLPRLSSESLLSIALQIAEGMEYLARQRFVHRDLACRNCLVGSGLKVKIADFGMSRDVYTCDYYKIGGTRMLPVRWMAPECIMFGRFTLESDIWSYGVVLWEIYSYGKQPYFGHSNDEVLKFILERNLLDIPEACPEEISEIMIACWRKDPKERVTFSEMRNRLIKMQEAQTRYNVLPLPRPPLETITIVHPTLLKNETDIEEEDRTGSYEDVMNDSDEENKDDDLDEDGYLKATFL